jgi:small redox-active disulfide protein 2
MKHIKVLGSGCANCKSTAALIQEVAVIHGAEFTLEKVEKIEDIMRYGIMSTPGVVIDDVVVHAGGVPQRAKVESWFSS